MAIEPCVVIFLQLVSKGQAALVLAEKAAGEN